MTLDDDQIIVLVTHRRAQQWFVSERDLWVLDHDAWALAYEEAGYATNYPDHDERFGIAVVSEANAADFLALMQSYAVDVAELDGAATIDYEPAMPALWVDFDARRVTIDVERVESPDFAEYLPPGWSAAHRSFLAEVDERLRFW